MSMSIRTWASGLVRPVTVVTARAGTEVHAGTVTTATLSGMGADSGVLAAVSVHVRADGRLADLARRAGAFAVNWLAHDQKAVAEWFACPGRASTLDQFVGLDWSFGSVSGAPVLADGLGWLDCRFVDQVTLVTDDAILVGLAYAGSFAGRTRPGLVRQSGAYAGAPGQVVVRDVVAGFE